jgi:hypothetical protein
MHKFHHPKHVVVAHVVIELFHNPMESLNALHVQQVHIIDIAMHSFVMHVQLVPYRSNQQQPVVPNVNQANINRI